MNGNLLADMILDPSETYNKIKRYDGDLSDGEIRAEGYKWSVCPNTFEFDQGDFVDFCRALIMKHEQKRGEVVITSTRSGEPLVVTRQNEEGQIVKVIWEKNHPQPSLLDRVRSNYDYE
jgi:hypothetical protein